MKGADELSMKIVMFYHSLLSDWNHGNAHFLRGVASELLERGHRVEILEGRTCWSRENLVRRYGEGPIRDFRRAYPALGSTIYADELIDLEEVLDGTDLALVHEWNPAWLVNRIGSYRVRNRRPAALFHDTHHRAVTDREAISSFDLRGFDGVLAFGEALRQIYLKRSLARRAWTWHEAADIKVFRPLAGGEIEGDVVWIGNWGDGERTEELQELLIGPAAKLGLRGRVYGVRYPAEARRLLGAASLKYSGWLPNFRVPEVFSRHLFTVHIPRRPYLERLPGIPTIRVFEALACGIPLICSRWRDSEGLFSPGKDFLEAADRQEMTRHMRDIVHDPGLVAELAAHGLRTIRERHTCAHRVDELLEICAGLGVCGDDAADGEVKSCEA